MTLISLLINYGFAIEKLGLNYFLNQHGPIAAVLTLFFYLSLYILTRGAGIGFGDVKLAPILVGLAASVSWQRGFIAFIGGILLAGFFVLPLILFRYLKRKSAIPLGSFLIIGTWIAIFVPIAGVDKFISLWMI